MFILEISFGDAVAVIFCHKFYFIHFNWSFFSFYKQDLMSAIWYKINTSTWAYQTWSDNNFVLIKNCLFAFSLLLSIADSLDFMIDVNQKLLCLKWTQINFKIVSY